MKSTTYRQLSNVHLLHRIWHNELELALQEVTFWEELLGTLSEVAHPKEANAQTWQMEIDHQCLRQEMDSFHADFRAFKTNIRQYMVTKTTF